MIQLSYLSLGFINQKSAESTSVTAKLLAVRIYSINQKSKESASVTAKLLVLGIYK